MRLSRDDVLKANDIVTEEVEVKEWGGSVLVRGLTGAQRDRYVASLSQQRGSTVVRNPVNATARLVIQCVVDDDGRLLFGGEDIEVLGAKSGAALDRVFEVAARLSGLSQDDIADIEGNSPATQSAGSTSS